MNTHTLTRRDIVDTTNAPAAKLSDKGGEVTILGEDKNVIDQFKTSFQNLNRVDDTMVFINDHGGYHFNISRRSRG